MSLRSHIGRIALVALLAAAACRKDPVPDPVPVPVVSTDLENGAVASYLDYVYTHPYDDNDYTYSYIDDFCNVTTDYRKDHPNPVRVSWQRDHSSEGQLLYVSTSSDFKDELMTITVGNNTCAYSIYNLIPGRHYYFKAVATMSDWSETVLHTCEFDTYGRRRMLNIDGIYNVRDLGGVLLNGGADRIRYGRLFRGGRMNSYSGDDVQISITSSGRTAMRQVGVKADLDLRKDSEADRIKSSPLGTDIVYKRFPNSSSGWYERIMYDEASVNISELQWIIDQLRADRPVYFHCSVGADRTGTLAFLIEGLLGASENEMAMDYELTSFSRYPGVRRRSWTGDYYYCYMVEVLKTFPGATLQDKFYKYFLNGRGGVSISAADLDWFIGHMTEPNL